MDSHAIIMIFIAFCTMLNVWIIFRRLKKGLLLSAGLDASMFITLKGIFGMSFDAGAMASMVSLFISFMLGKYVIEHFIRDYFHNINPFHKSTMDKWNNL